MESKQQQQQSSTARRASLPSIAPPPVVTRLMVPLALSQGASRRSSAVLKTLNEFQVVD